MVQRSAVLAVAVLALLSGSPATVESREQEEQLAMTLTCKPPSFKTRTPLMVVNGGVALPDGAALKLSLSRAVEEYVGVKIQSKVEQVGSGLAGVEAKRFVFENGIQGPGKYTVRVDLNDDDQRKPLVAEVRKRAGTKRLWQFEVLAWGDDLLTELAPRLVEFQALGKESLELIKKFEAACRSKEEWEANAKELVKENGKLMSKIDGSPLKAYYPAATVNLYYTIRNIQGTAPYFNFSPDGKFAGGKSYHADNQEIKTFRQEGFNYDNLKRYAEESIPVAGREYALWVIKDMRRSAGTLRPAVLESLKSMKAAPGVDLFVDRLEKATIGDLDALEAEIRTVVKDVKQPEKK